MTGKDLPLTLEEFCRDVRLYLPQVYDLRLLVQKQSNNQSATVTRVNPGSYQIRFPGLARVGSATDIVMVSAAGAGAGGPCISGGWSVSGSDMLASVHCFNSQTGARIDQQFSIMLVQ